MNTLSRRTFLRYCTLSAAALGLGPSQLGLLRKAMANPQGPSVIWLHGSSCTGCSVSLLNRIVEDAGQEKNIASVLVENINLVYHATIMSSAGDPAVADMLRLAERGGYVLVLEGGVPTAFGGHCCVVYSYNGVEVTYMQAVQEFAAKAAAIVCVGTCASFGGIPHAGSNPTGVVSVGELTGRPTINISGCPANPDWIVWAIVQLILGNDVILDEDRRPVALYNTDLAGAPADPCVHAKCPRNGNPEADSFADVVTPLMCLRSIGCRGPSTKARCDACWNGIAGHANATKRGTWCIGVNAPCHGCVEKTFPGNDSFYESDPNPPL